MSVNIFKIIWKSFYSKRCILFGEKCQSKSYIQHLKTFQKYIGTIKCFIVFLHDVDRSSVGQVPLGSGHSQA